MANNVRAWSSTMDRAEERTTGDGKRTRGTEDGTEERVRGRVISFLCLLLIYSDAPRLSASGANKFLEPPRQLDTLHPPLSPCTFSPHAPRFRCPSCPPFSPPPLAIHRSDEIFRPHRTVCRRRGARCSGHGEKAAYKRDTRPHAGILYI